MKHIYVLRHAKSQWPEPPIDDFDRPLNERGRKNAAALGAWLKAGRLIPQVIFHSPAARAAETVRHLTEDWTGDT